MRPHLVFPDGVVLAFGALVVDKLVLLVDLLNVSGQDKLVDEGQLAVRANVLDVPGIVNHGTEADLAIGVMDKVLSPYHQKNCPIVYVIS